MQSYFCYIEREIKARSPEEAARRFAEEVDERGSLGFIVDVFNETVTLGLNADKRAGAFDPDQDFELI